MLPNTILVSKVDVNVSANSPYFIISLILLSVSSFALCILSYQVLNPVRRSIRFDLIVLDVIDFFSIETFLALLTSIKWLG